MNIHLLAIDVQNDFCDPKGSLFVTGANEDTIRLSNMVNRLRGKINDIHATLDSHNYIDIAHPIFWINSKGEHPTPFTIISKDDVVKGLWTTSNPACKKRATEYVKKLDENNRYPLCIWPQHCVISSWGWLFPEIFEKALSNWCTERFKKVDYQIKGSNIFTEHYSAVKADVIDPSDPSTMLNTGLIKTLGVADEILIAGQALSHCVNFTVSDIADNFDDSHISKFVLLTDACSSVPGFEKEGEAFVEKMIKRGMRVSTTTEYLA
jgi:nicotinamidase/pyrazinamidase